ncbi:response regulator [Coemansia interrupta]|uniref:Response regulator n=1 Tax=Coemansia interrupta TaxID=1126814 RepID=A0A9W8LNT5_9FUNG|nr:response regulator [Coemansia interrupta]
MEQRAAASKVNRQWVLAFALLAFRRALDATDNNRRRQLALGMSGIIAVLSGSLDSQRNQWALLASGLALLGAIKQDPHASAGETLSNLRAERARFCRLLQAHMQLAVRGAQAVMESDAMESITVSASGIASTMFLVNHVERCSRADPAALDPTDTNIGFLECLQSIADVLAARASELEVQMSFALPTPPYSGHQAVEAVFPIDDEIAYMHGNWKLQQEAVQPIRHVFLESACLLLERHLQATDEVCIVPRCSRNSDGCAVVYFVCRRSLRGVADEDSKEALHSTPWSNARLTEILQLLSGIEGYLREFGCNVERKVGVSMGTPSTPGTSVQMVAQKPPAFVIIDDDIDLLRTEFEALRGTLTFSSGKGVSGSPLSFQQTQETSTSGGIGIRRRGFAATLGIVVLVPIKSMAEYRDCVRAMTLAPHPLPPPVVRIVPKPISERRLLVSLRAAWYARRTRPSVTGYPLGNQPHPPASPQLVPPSAHLASYDHSTLSTPRSTGSEGMYSNLRTVADVSGVFPEPHVPTLEIPIPVKRKDRKQRPEAIGIVTKNDDMDMDNQAGESPPSPLIRVDPVLAKSMRCATSPREAPVLEPRSDYISRLDTVIEGESDSTGNAATSVIDKAASPVNSPNAEPNNLVATVTADQRRKSQTQADAELHRVDTTESSVSASVLALQTKTSIDLERGAIDSSSISKTRSLLRDKMALFNRAKQKARNKFRGISDAHTADDDDSVSVVPPNRSDTVDSEESLTTLPAEPAVKEEVENTPATHPLNLQPPPLTVTRPSIQIQKSHQSADVDVDKPLPALPAAVQEIESSRESIAATSTDSAPSQTAGSAVPKATAPNAARDRKARLRARLQNASKKLAESQKMAQQPTDGRSENSDASSMKSRERKVLSSSSGGSSGTTKKRISNPQPQPQPQLQSDSVQQQQQQHQGRSAGTANKNGSGNVPPIRVLIVEDNLINRSIMERFLRHMDVYYDVASNGEEAITMWTAAAEEKRQDGASPGNAVEGPYHIVFMDIQMPIMDGITATKHIRGLERQRRIGVWEDKGSVARMAAGGTARSASLRWQPYRANSGGSQAGDTSDQVLSLPVVKSPVIIVALTASSLQSDRHAALAAGCNDFLTKPVSLIWLKKKIMEWGCMQALVDHEGWQRWRTLRENAGAPSQAK